MLAVGDMAPDFTLEGTDGETVRDYTLSEFTADRPTALVFYIYDYSPVCTDQMCEVNDMDLLTLNDDVAVLGISTDGPYSHQNFIRDHELSYPLLTDDNKEVYDQYGLLDQTPTGKRRAKRGIVLLDTDRTVQYAWKAKDNWDEWDIEPLSRLNDRVNELIA